MNCSFKYIIIFLWCFAALGKVAASSVAENAYNALGQLVKTELHGGLETVNCEYNIRGWLTGISGENFSEKLHYHDVVPGLNNTPQWGGNISAMEWQTPGLNAGWHAFKYDYDPLSRLTAGKYSGSNAPGSSYGTNAGYFDESYAYDIMGNMTSLARKHLNTPIDALTFGYTGNMLHQVADGENNSLGFSGTGNYTYDMAGRMTGDSQKGTIAYNHLGLTKSVTKGSDVLKYTYDATGRRIKKQLNNTAPRWYMDGVECSGDTTMIHTEYGRIRRNAVAEPWKWDYFLKDHLGNVRVVLEAPASSAPSTQSNTILYMATMEEGASPNPSQGGETAAYENLYFANLESTRADKPYNYPDQNPLNQKVAKVPGKSKGPSILLPVLAGDTISISAKAFYNMDKTLPGQGVDVAPVLGSAIAAMSSPAATLAGEATQLAVDLGAEASQSVALVNVPQIVDKNEEAKPQSGINFVLYNSRMEVVEENTGVLPVEDRINEIQTLASDHLIMQEAGFLEVYINNEAQTPVYYDNFAVAATTSNVVEVNAYYPYGMIIPGLSLMAPPGKWNGYKYSAKELQTELGLNWGDHGERMADYIIGRWRVPDPLAEKYYNISTYAFVANNPIRYIDPNGMNLDDYLLKKNGEIELLKKTDDKYDVLYVDNDNGGKKDINQDGTVNESDGLKVNDRHILPDLAKTDPNMREAQVLSRKSDPDMLQVHYAKTESSKDALNVFTFSATHSNVEWSFKKFQNGNYVIGTLNEYSQAPHFRGLGVGYGTENIVRDIHSHPGTTRADFEPSGFDVHNARTIRSFNKNAKIWLFMPKNPKLQWWELY